jgi:hypothetical protein
LAVQAGAGSGGSDEDELLDGGDLLAVVVLLELQELRLDVLDEGVALSALELAEEFFWRGVLVALL